MHVYTDNAFAGIYFSTASVKIVRPSQKVVQRQIDVQSLSPEEKRQLRDNLFSEFLPLEQMQVEKRNAILDEQHDFVISIRSGQQPQVTGEQGREALAVAHRILEAIAEHHRALHKPSVVPVPPWHVAAEQAAPAARKAG